MLSDRRVAERRWGYVILVLIAGAISIGCNGRHLAWYKPPLTAEQQRHRTDSIRVADSIAEAEFQAWYVKPDSIRFRPNALFIEFAGSSILGAINYDRRIGKHFVVRVGAGALWLVASFPITASYLIPLDSAHSFELGGGVVYAAFAAIDAIGPQRLQPLANLILGYRYQPYDAGELFRIGFTPFYSNGRVFPSIGVSLGATF